VAGGVAAVLYGNPRFTKDLDLFVDLEEKNLSRLIKVFRYLKFVPRVPVNAEDFISPVNRRRWMKEKGMKAFTFINPKNPIENIDILLASPVSFSVAYRRRKFFEAENVRIPTVSRRDLIVMKRKAGRLQDKQDIAILKQAGRRRIK
jgi:hypothetical protein